LITLLLVIAGYALAGTAVFVSAFDKPPRGIMNGLAEWILSLDANARVGWEYAVLFFGISLMVIGFGCASRGAIMAWLRYRRAK
jgi:hypothetical protein